MIYIDELRQLYKIKLLIENSKSIEAAKNIYESYLLDDKDYYNNLEKTLISSLIDENRFNKKIPELELSKYIGKYYMDELLLMTDDTAQRNIIKRYGRISGDINTNTQTTTKFCPHCNQKFVNYTGETYVICGYTGNPRGYDWTGCKRDWCYKCNKKLCKVWDINELYDERNRVHTTCCKKYSRKNKIPLEEFCSCNYINFAN